MLPARQRLRASSEFAAAVSGGGRSGTRTLVVHLGEDEGSASPRVGFIVSRAVGNAVVRNRVKRRLRHLARERLNALPRHAVLVVRALPPAAEADWSTLGADFDRALGKVISA